jgi:hypothetical protein
MFSCIEDIFLFFRVKPGHFGYGEESLYINPGYWSEKLLAVDNATHAVTAARCSVGTSSQLIVGCEDEVCFRVFA